MNLKTKRGKIQGFQLFYNNNDLGNFNNSISITNGCLVFDNLQDGEIESKWKNEFVYKNNQNLNLLIKDNYDYDPKLINLYLRPNFNKRFNNLVECDVNFIEIPKDKIYNFEPINEYEDDIFIGSVLIPALYPQKDNLFVFRTYNFNSILTQNIIDFNFYRNSLCLNVEKWKTNFFYFKDQIVLNDNKLYKCLQLHKSTNFSVNFKNDFWVLIAGGTGGEIPEFNFELYDYRLEKIYNRDYLCVYQKIFEDNNTQKLYATSIVWSKKIIL